MPYINAETRAELAPQLNVLKETVDRFGLGVLNYIITQLIVKWIGPQPSYRTYNDVIGVLECVKLELYRRMVAPYEDVKRGENGDVYPETFGNSKPYTVYKGDTPHERG